VGLCAWAGKWATIPPMRGKRHKNDLLALLAQLPLNREKQLDELTQQARPLLRNSATAVLLTPHEERLSSVNLGRNNFVAVPADSPRAKGWFKFDAGVDFMASMPVEQQPVLIRS
jgi:hypothetical protein